MPNYSYKRSQRVGELLHHKISEIIQHLKDPELGITTITEVKLTDDLRIAKVYYSVFGDDNAKKAAGVVLNRAVSYIRHEIAEGLVLRLVPEILFYYDDTAEKAARIGAILQQLKTKDSDIHTAGKGQEPDSGSKKIRRQKRDRKRL
ncbi:MAG: 30S ribosome-binding factor RbfA [Elusimicrobiota bacterium]